MLVSDVVAAEARARVAGALGLTALSLVMVAPCACGGTLPIGGLLGIGAAIAGLRAAAEEPSGAGRAWARAGTTTGVSAAMVTLVVLLLLGAAFIAQVLGAISAVESARQMLP